MLPDCTPAVERALEAATRCAAGEVQPVDLLARLLDEEGRATALLQRTGVDVEAFRRHLPSSPASRSETRVPLSDLTRQALVRARARATEAAVDGEQLLVALLATDARLRQSLAAVGVSLAALEQQLPESAEVPVPLDEPLHLLDLTERMDTARVLDAAANRAREALRVVEDYCRFVLDDAFLCSELKQVRHGLRDVFEELSSALLLTARETQVDVGTTISTPSESERRGLRDVLQANLKRLQEALRSLEEFGKLHSADMGRRLEQLRYQSYTLEKALLLGADVRQLLANARLYVLLTGARCRAALDWTIQEIADGGASIVQLREKHLNDRDLLERARQVRRWTRKAGLLFIMNDRPDLARLAEADGVHVGQEELSVRDVRRIVGPDMLVGVSTHNLDQLRRAILDGASYVGVGPTFPSGTKDFTEFAGLDFVRQAAADTSLPAFVIGGVTVQTIGQAVAAGARRVAVSQAICDADEPRAVAAELLNWLNGSVSDASQKR